MIGLAQKLLLNFVLCFVLVNSGRLRNEAVVLSSVYDAMRNNFENDDVRNSLNYELRNKRNTNERWDYEKSGHQEPVYQAQFSKSDGYRTTETDTGEDQVPTGNDLICSVYRGQNERQVHQNPFLDHSNWQVFGGVSYFMGKAVKFVLSGIALVSLPIMFLVGIGIPLKILLSLKAMTVTNSLVFGSLIYRLLNRFLLRPPMPRPPNPDEPEDVDNNDNDLDNNKIVNHRLHGILDRSDENGLESNVEFDREKLQEILESIKTKNKDW